MPELHPGARLPVILAALALTAGVAVPGAASGLTEEVLARINRERAEAGAEPLARSETLERAALAKARKIGDGAAATPSARPSHITALAQLDDLPDYLRAVDFSARQASAHVVVSDQPLDAADLTDEEPGLRADLLDPRLRELGLGVVREGKLEIVVAIVGLSKKLDFEILTRDLADLDETRGELLRLTNQARRKRQRTPLRRDRCLHRAAQRYAERMLAEGFYGHLSPEGEDVAMRVRGGGCPRAHVGENLARGQTSVRQVMDGWLESPGHRDNLLQPDFRRVGFGLAMGRRGDEYWILWVQVLSGES